MAKWVATDKQFAFNSSTIQGGGIKASFDLDEGVGYFEQDIGSFKEKAKEDRDFQSHYGHLKDGYRKFAIIPDSVALKVLEDHKLDIHDQHFMSNPANLKKLKRIIISEYPDLVVNT